MVLRLGWRRRRLGGRPDDFDDHLLVPAENIELSDDALAASFSEWLRELDEQETLRVSARAADTLAEARAAGEVCAHPSSSTHRRASNWLPGPNAAPCFRRLFPAGAVPWVPDGLFDVEVGSVLRRWELVGVLTAEQMAATLLRSRSSEVRRASVRVLHDQAWSLRHNMTFGDAVHVALTRRVAGVLLTDDHKLTNAPTLDVPS